MGVGVSTVGWALQAWKGRAPTIPFFSLHSKTMGRQAHQLCRASLPYFRSSEGKPCRKLHVLSLVLLLLCPALPGLGLIPDALGS